MDSQPTLMSPQVYCTVCSIPVVNFKKIQKTEDKIALCSCGKKYFVKAEHFKFMKQMKSFYEKRCGVEIYKIID